MSDGSSDARRGGLDMLVSAFFFSLMSLQVKWAGERLPAVQIVLARAVVSLVLSVWLIRRAGLDWKGNRPRLLLLRGVFGVVGLVCFFRAITLLDLGDVTVLHHTNPLFTALLAAAVLGERFSRRHLLAISVCLCGIVLVARPAIVFGGTSRMPVEGVVIALVGALAAAAAYVTVRALGRSEAPLVVVLYFPLVAVPVATPFAVAVWVPPTAEEWLLLLGVGVTTQIAQVFLTRGLHRLPAGPATAIGYVQIVFAVLWGWIFFGVFPDRYGIAGALLVVAGVLLLGRRRRRLGRPVAVPPL